MTAFVVSPTAAAGDDAEAAANDLHGDACGFEIPDKLMEQLRRGVAQAERVVEPVLPGAVAGLGADHGGEVLGDPAEIAAGSGARTRGTVGGASYGVGRLAAQCRGLRRFGCSGGQRPRFAAGGQGPQFLESAGLRGSQGQHDGHHCGPRAPAASAAAYEAEGAQNPDGAIGRVNRAVCVCCDVTGRHRAHAEPGVGAAGSVAVGIEDALHDVERDADGTGGPDYVEIGHDAT